MRQTDKITRGIPFRYAEGSANSPESTAGAKCSTKRGTSLYGVYVVPTMLFLHARKEWEWRGEREAVQGT